MLQVPLVVEKMDERGNHGSLELLAEQVLFIETHLERVEYRYLFFIHEPTMCVFRH